MALSNLEKEALKGIVEFEKAYLNEVFGKTQLNATTNERSAATASYPGYLAAAKSNSGNSGAGGGFSGSGGGNLNPGTIARGILQAQQSSTLSSNYAGEVTHLTDVADGFLDKTTGHFKGVGEMIKSFVNKSLSEVNTIFAQQADLQELLNGRLAMTGELSSEFNKNIMYSLPYAMRLGLTFDDVSKMVGKMVEDSGRFKLMSTETINQMSLMSRVAFNNVEEAANAIEPFQKVSRGATDAMKVVEKASLGSLQLGLNAKETTKKLVENVDKLNSYGFKNGIDGLTKMVQKAQGLRIELQTTFDLAEKVMDPTKALELSANLQAIGGAVGAFNDPIRMMWMATNNVEGLQDALAQSAENLVTFNKASGTFEVTGANLRRARDMATDLGMSFKDLTNLGVQAAQRTSAAADLMGKGLIFKNEGDKEFLTNLAQMKDGKMTIELPDNLKQQFGANSLALESLDQSQTEMIIKFRDEFKEMSAKDIAVQQVNSVRNIERNINFITATMRVEALKRGTDIVKMIGYDPMKAITETREFADAIANKTIDLSTGLGKQMKSMYDKYISKDQNPGTNNSSPTATTPRSTSSNQNLNVTISANAGSDEIARVLRSNPGLAEKVWGAYINPQAVQTGD